MEWDNEKCLELIGLYKEKSELWQSDHKYYYNKLKKHDAWEEMATKMEVSVDLVKGRMNSLLASHRREKSKEESSKGTRKGKDEVYRSKWFAYKALRFIKDKNKCKQTLSSSRSQDYQETNIQVQGSEGLATGDSDMEDENICMNADDSEESEQELTSQLTSNMTSQAPTSKRETFVKPTAPNKRKKLSPTTVATSQVDQVMDILKRSADRDDCDAYGEHVALKLKTYEKRTQAIVQHYINNILFDADIGSLHVLANSQLPPMSRSCSAPPSPYSIQLPNSQRYATLASLNPSVSSNSSDMGLVGFNAEECDREDTPPALPSTFTTGTFYSDFRP